MKDSSDSLENLKQVADAAGVDSIPELWEAQWSDSQATRPTGFDRDDLKEACTWLGMEAEVAEALEGARATIEEHACLQQLAWLGHSCFFSEPDKKTDVKNWPTPKGTFGPFVGLFWPVVLLSGIKKVREVYRKAGIDEAITLDTLSDLELWIKHEKEVSGEWCFKEVGWLSNHFSCTLLKLGRLQYIRSTFPHDLHAFRHRQEKRIVVLAGEGMEFRADGQFANADGQQASEGVWTATYERNASKISGFPLDPRGTVRHEPLQLNAADWEPILEKGDPVLDTHIPATGPMGHQACGESHQWAQRFYPSHYPDWAFKAFICSSWLLDPQLQIYLKPTSNVVLYQKEFFLHPKPGANDNQHFERVFGGPVSDLDAAPQESSMQRALIKHCKAGGRWRLGCSILFREQFEWGNPSKFEYL